MPVEIALAVSGDNTIQGIRHVSADIFVPIFVEGERAASVLDEELQNADFVGLQFGELRDNVVGHQVGTS
jgi:hypothetical protein